MPRLLRHTQCPPFFQAPAPEAERRTRCCTLVAAAFGALTLTACSGPQSALDPAGREAQGIANLFWWMTGGAFVVWIAVVLLTVYALRGRRSANEKKQAAYLIIGGGVVVPTVVLTALLIYGLGLMPPLLARAPEGALRVAVSGEQWWWRVRYLPAEGGEAVLANEIRLPVGEVVEFELESPDVIHSFWIPALAGKMDMIPGRRTRLALQPTRTGTFRGVCAEYCGASHALMAFPVVVMEKAAFAEWLAGQRAGAVSTSEDPVAAEGRAHFFANGCSACHAIRGTEADGVVGPDLTHVGSRLSVGAGILPNDPDGFSEWLARTDRVKPGVTMPHFGMLPAEELRALAVFLESLQ